MKTLLISLLFMFSGINNTTKIKIEFHSLDSRIVLIQTNNSIEYYAYSKEENNKLLKKDYLLLSESKNAKITLGRSYFLAGNTDRMLRDYISIDYIDEKTLKKEKKEYQLLSFGNLMKIERDKE